MSSPVPLFRYHPDPVATGNVVPQQIVCGVCGQPREFAYVGPYVSPDAHFANGDPICPWCIADGSAAARWKASFVAPAYLSDQAREQMPPERLAELEERTPSFLCLQQEYWLDHHGEAAAYVGEIGYEEYRTLPRAAQLAVLTAAGDDPKGRPEQTLLLRADGDGPAVYLFKCLHCPEYGAFYAAA